MIVQKHTNLLITWRIYKGMWLGYLSVVGKRCCVAYVNSLMATAHDRNDVNVDDLRGAFDLSSVAVYNIVNLGRFVLNSFCNTFNFSAELKLVNNKRTCARCRHNLKLSVENRPGHTTPVVFRCTNRRCRTNYVSIRQGSFCEHSRICRCSSCCFWSICSVAR